MEKEEGGIDNRGAFRGGIEKVRYWVDCFRRLWSNCQNIGSPLSLGLFEGQNESK